jgi:hypothetical protein
METAPKAFGAVLRRWVAAGHPFSTAWFRVEAVNEAFIKERAEHDRLAKPYEASGASMALWVLQSLDTNDVDGAKSELVQTIANYYRPHRDDGDTDILAAITAFAAKDAALSNAIYHK